MISVCRTCLLHERYYIDTAIVQNSISCPADSKLALIMENQCSEMTFSAHAAHIKPPDHRTNRLCLVLSLVFTWHRCDPKCHDIYVHNGARYRIQRYSVTYVRAFRVQMTYDRDHQRDYNNSRLVFSGQTALKTYNYICSFHCVAKNSTTMRLITSLLCRSVLFVFFIERKDRCNNIFFLCVKENLLS